MRDYANDAHTTRYGAGISDGPVVQEPPLISSARLQFIVYRGTLRPIEHA